VATRVGGCSSVRLSGSVRAWPLAIVRGCDSIGFPTATRPIAIGRTSLTASLGRTTAIGARLSSSSVPEGLLFAKSVPTRSEAFFPIQCSGWPDASSVSSKPGFLNGVVETSIWYALPGIATRKGDAGSPSVLERLQRGQFAHA
jgi:hypothetical protein